MTLGAKIQFLFQFCKYWPTIFCPVDGTLDKNRGAIVGNAIAVADEDILTIHVIGRTMACCFEVLFIAFEEEFATTIAHIGTIGTQIGAVDSLAAAYGYTVIALSPLTAIVP